MPRAGGVYYFLDRSLGPLVGTVGGVGTWLAVSLKAAFALVGMGAYLALFFPELPIREIAIGFTLIIGALCLYGAKTSGGFQVLLVIGLLCILAAFIGGGLPLLQGSHFEAFFEPEASSILSTAGFVYISYVGVTTVASLAEEVKDPERNLPLGVFLALGTAILVYGLGTSVIVGLVPPDRLAGDLTSAATAADILIGGWGTVLISVAAILAFTSVANAGLLSASRLPLAMSRDHLAHPALRHLGRRGTPTYSILLTVGLIVVVLVFLDPMYIAKLASAFQLTVFGLASVAVIVMRESRIESYDPGYRSPGYPWMQLFGVTAAGVLIVEMGTAPALFCVALVGLSSAYYWFYGRARIDRTGAIFHVFQRLGERRSPGLDPELRSLLKEKGLREEDPFEEVIARAETLDAADGMSFEDVVEQASALLAPRLPCSAENLREGFLQGTRIGVGSLLGTPHSSEPVYALCFLVSPEHDPARHLRLLAQIASRVDQDDFQPAWLDAGDEHALKEVLLRNERFLSLGVHRGSSTEALLGRAIREISFPDGCLVAIVRRSDEVIVPRGSTVLHEGDWLTVIGTPSGIRHLHQQFPDELEHGTRGPA
jgi:amino acid transporter